MIFYFLTITLFVGLLNAQQGQSIDSISIDSLNTTIEKKNKFKTFGLTQFTFNQARSPSL